MEFGLNEDPTYPQTYRIDFTRDESSALSAAFREELNLNIEQGGADKVTTFEAKLATWPDGSERAIYVNSTKFITTKLKEFAQRTSEQAKELVVGSMKAYFDNRDAARRIILGREAEKLADDLDKVEQGQVREDATPQKQLNKPQ